MRRPGLAGLSVTAAIMLLASFRLAALEVYLQPEVAREGDIIDLVLQYESGIPSLYGLDTEPLLRDFEVIDAQSRIQRLSGNDQQQLRMQWVVKITPRHSGNLEIPPLQLGEMRSQPIRLEVAPRSQADRRNVDVTIELDAVPADPYVGQEVHVTMRLISNTPMSKSRISEPAVARSRLFRSTQERQRKETRDGATYDVLERSISLFADQPGKLTLGEAIFTGSLANQAQRQIIRRSRPLVLEVSEAPAGSVGQLWLPARKLDLRLDWDVAPDRLEVGDSLGLELQITAHGLPAEALPNDLLAVEHPAFRIYPDEARLSDDFIGASIVGRLRQSFVFVASRAGTIEIPPIELRWWHTRENGWRRSKLPGRQVRVHVPVPPGDHSSDWQRILDDERTAAAPEPAADTALLILVPAILVLILIASGLPVGRRLLARIRKSRDLRVLERSFRDACLRDDPLAARTSLLAWARRRWPGNNYPD